MYTYLEHDSAVLGLEKPTQEMLEQLYVQTLNRDVKSAPSIFNLTRVGASVRVILKQ